MSIKSQLERIQKRVAAKREARNQCYTKPMDNLELIDRLKYMMTNPTQVEVRAAFKVKFPERYQQLVEMIGEP